MVMSGAECVEIVEIVGFSGFGLLPDMTVQRKCRTQV
jgi:hypothetical protein